LQFAFLNPALGLLLVTWFDATPAQVGWALAAFNASGFVASLVVPAWADRRQDYLRPMIFSGLFSLALVTVLAITTRIPVVVIALVLLGGPASVGSTLLFAHLRHSGAGPSVVVQTRAWVSVAWVIGPPLATVLISSFGSQAILLAIAAVAVLGIAASAAMLAERSSAQAHRARPPAPDSTDRPASKLVVTLICTSFIVLQATNYVVVSIMGLYVTQRLGLDLVWVTLGVAAALEVPALLLIARLGRRFTSIGLLASGCIAGIGYYLAMTLLTGPVPLLFAQLLNAWFFAAIAGVGLVLFQELIPRPGLASGLYTNTRRLGAIAAGPIIALGSRTALGYSGIFALCAALTAVALVVLVAARRKWRRARFRQQGEPPELITRTGPVVRKREGGTGSR
jgi:SET family sugar efflux transporter-like MFS transporter